MTEKLDLETKRLHGMTPAQIAAVDQDLDAIKQECRA
jgi:hypothetical protein